MEMSEADLGDQNQEDLVLDAEEKKEELVQAVKGKRILYDPSSVSNRNQFLREQAWAEVANSIGMPGSWCKSEWTKLRNLYTKKKKAIVGKTGQKRKKIEAWSHYFSMQFLDDFLVAGSTTGNVPELPPAVNMDGNVEDALNVSGEQINQSDGAPIPQVAGHSGAVPSKEIEKEKTCVTYSAKRHLKKDDKVDDEIVNYLSAKRAKLDQKDANDDDHHFGMSVAARLRKMDQRTASFTKMKIMEALHKSEFPTQNEVNDDYEVF